MKKLFLFSIVLLVILSLSPVAFAQEEIILPTHELSSSMAATQQNDPVQSYVLPYPGLLPDNPLYILKTFRDRMIGLLISDPTKQAEFNLLQADKRLQAGLYLYQQHKGKEELAFTTFDKGENYFEQSIAKIKAAKQQGIGNGEIILKVYISAQKHEAVYKDLLKKAPKKYVSRLTNLIKRTDQYENQVKPLVPKSQQ